MPTERCVPSRTPRAVLTEGGQVNALRGMGDKAQKSHIRAIKDFAAFLGRSPDTATPENLRACQLHMADTGVK